MPRRIEGTRETKSETKTGRGRLKNRKIEPTDQLWRDLGAKNDGDSRTIELNQTEPNQTQTERLKLT